jgi:hypothetical protein
MTVDSIKIMRKSPPESIIAINRRLLTFNGGVK